jgi:serine/threonine-protein kinase
VRRLTDVLLARNKAEDAESFLREYVATAAETLASDSWQIATARSLLGACRFARGDFEDAEHLLLESRRIMSRKLGERQELTQQAIQRVVKLYEAWDKPEQAAKWQARLVLNSGQ